MHDVGNWESTRKAFEWHEAKPSASLASRVLSQLPKCIHNSTDAELKHGPFLLEHCHFKGKLIKHRILLNHAERFRWLNAITQFDRRTVLRLSRFRPCLHGESRGGYFGVKRIGMTVGNPRKVP